MVDDAAVIATAQDAYVAKAATVAAGYYDDPFLIAPPPRHVQPIIKRGTHARVACVDRALRVFREQGGRQVVVLGAGHDTAFFRHHGLGIRWFETDHESVLRSKARNIEAHPEIFGCQLRTSEDGSYSIEKDGFTCCGVVHDLQEPSSVLLEKHTSHGWNSHEPTLVILECVAMYLPQSACLDLFETLFHASSQCHICLYDPILQNDSFGRVMEQHLRQRQAANSSLLETRTLEAQKKRLAGWNVVAYDMNQAYGRLLTAEERQRAAKAEFLDELEEWTLLMQHYCFLVASHPEASFQMGNVIE